MAAQASTLFEPRALPRVATSFVGREDELAEIRRQVLEWGGPLITLVGPGRIGKSRLAIESAASITAELADGAAFVPLQAVASGEALVLAIAEAVNFPVGRPRRSHEPAAGLPPGP